MNILKKEKRKELLSILVSILSVALLYLFFHITGIGCPIRFLTGISCPGCGMTRAVFSLLCLDPASAFHYHPLVFFLPFIFIVYLFRRKISSFLYKFFIFTSHRFRMEHQPVPNAVRL